MAPKAELLITTRAGEIPLAATSSACMGVTFHPKPGIAKPEDQRKSLVDLFLVHWERVHMHKDFKEAIARPVRPLDL